MIKKDENGLDLSERLKFRNEIYEQIKSYGIFENETCLNDKDYVNCVSDILVHPRFQQMNEYIQHGTTTTMTHCLYVSYMSYSICKKHGLDFKAAARGGLLHDLFLYDWHTHKALTGECFHGFTHPKVACKNADFYFDINEKERDIIIKHMWPITIIPPKSFEGFVVMYTDKYCGLVETVHRIKNLFTKKSHIGAE